MVVAVIDYVCVISIEDLIPTIWTDAGALADSFY